MSLSIMVQGTASDVGKSVLVAGLCRIFAQDGHRCAPFKAQNMALNSGITLTGEEMGRAQIFQAEAAGIAPDVRMNPVLLKPTSDRKSQVIVMGKVLRDMDAVTYHDFKPQLQHQIHEVYQSLASEYDIVVLEGAGSPAEINLRDRDIVNMGMAELIDTPVLLVADIDRGGVFASIYGTLMLLSEQERARVKGVIINKFRGDVALLNPGIQQIEALTNIPVIGVMPYLTIDLEDEDGVALQLNNPKHHQIKSDKQTELDIVVIQLPHIANFTDFNALAAQPDVQLRYVARPELLGKPDLIIVPGSKNTLGDLCFLNETGLSAEIIKQHQIGVPIFGICGGFQILGRRLVDGVESGIDEMAGLNLLNCTTTFAWQKITTQVNGHIHPRVQGLFSPCGTAAVSGYEIHMGETERGDGVQPFTIIQTRNQHTTHFEDGAINAVGSVAGTYIHGIFDSPEFTRTLLNQLRQRKNLAPLAATAFNYQVYKSKQFDLLADAMRENINIEQIYHIMKQQAQNRSAV